MKLLDPCVKCGGGSFYLDEALGDAVRVRASVCRTCGTRIELDPHGQALEIVQPTRKTHPVEEQVRVLLAQGVSVSAISRELRVSKRLVQEIMGDNRPPSLTTTPGLGQLPR